MTDWGSNELQHKVMLKEILKTSGQAITEEQAWALCYQCSCKFQQILKVSGLVPMLAGVEGIYIHQNGAVSFASTTGILGTCHSEEKVIEHLGKVVYSALDWGLSSDIERVLSDSLLSLLYRMVGLNDNCTSPTIELWKITLDEVIKSCVKRLFLPGEAPGHYKAVCRMQYGVYAEICNLLQTIKQSKQNLKKLERDKEGNDSVVFENWSTMWKGVMNELRVGMRLFCSKRRSYIARPVKYELAPYEMLMEDIRCKRYTLRKVEDKNQSKSSKSEENVNLDLIRSLKPASARKLREKPQEEPSLHELLMSEIKSSRSILKSTADGKKSFRRISFDEELRISDGVFSIPPDYPYYRCQLESRWNDFQDNHFEARISWNTEFSQESSSEQKFSNLTSSSSDLSFLPVWTSSQVDLRMNTGSSQGNLQMTCSSSRDKSRSSGSGQKKLSFGHKRSSSFEGFLQGGALDEQDWDFPGISLPPTVLELAPLRRMMVKTEVSVFRSSRDLLGQKACSNCRKRLLCWQVLCKFCERTICPECRVEMLMPHQKCMHLPVSFFKALVLTQESDLTQAKEFMQWNNSSVPLVMFHPKNLSGDFSFHKWIMYNWSSMSICVKCQEYILEVIKKNHHCEIPGGSLKSRSMSVSATPFQRH